MGWGGQGRAVDLRMAVEQVGSDQATLVLVRTVDGHPRLEHRTTGKFAGNTLVATLPSGTRMTYRLRDADTMEFVWRASPENWMAGVLARSNPAASMRKVRIPLNARAGKRNQTLEAVIFSPPGAGPFPTLVFNHGSTGKGSDPALFKLTDIEPSVARWFTQQGWMVVFPQRRGRGKSDGMYAEGLEPDGSGYSIRPEASLAGLEHALIDLDSVIQWLGQQKDVLATQILIGGQSRGGALALVHAARHPARYAGVVNFVGGWMGDGLDETRQINHQVFRRAAAFRGPTIWLYGENDPYYQLSHSRENFARFTQAGGKGEFHALATGSAPNGHYIADDESLWRKPMARFVEKIGG